MSDINTQDENHEKLLSCLYKNGGGPAELCFRYLSLVKTFGSDHPSLPQIVWNPEDNYKSLFFEDQQVSITMLSKLCHVLFDKAEAILKDDIFLEANFPVLGDPINPNNTVYADQFNNRSLSYNFFTDPQNEALTCDETRSYIMNHIFSTETLRIKYFGINNNEINALEFSTLFEKISEFVGIIAILIHITSGQPTRGTEITASSITNNTKGGLRSIYWCHKTIMLTQYYNKSSTVNGDKYIARFLPQPLAHLVVLYLCCVRPVERYLEHCTLFLFHF